MFGPNRIYTKFCPLGSFLNLADERLVLITEYFDQANLLIFVNGLVTLEARLRLPMEVMKPRVT